MSNVSKRTQTGRVNFAKIHDVADSPDLLAIQLQSFQDFFQLETTPDKRDVEGLFRVFKENFPITDTRNIFVLEFLDYFIDPPRYTIEECMERGLTYSVPLKAKLRLSCNDEEHVDFETIVQDVFLGNIPYMTPRGTFVINGAERVVVSQLHSFSGCVLRTKHPPERYQNLLCPCYSVQRSMDGVCYRYQQRHVCVYRPQEEIPGYDPVTFYRLRK